MEYDELSLTPRMTTKEYLIPAAAFTLFPLVFLVFVFAMPDTPRDVKIVVPPFMSIFLAVGISFSVGLIKGIVNDSTVKLLKKKGKRAYAVFESAKVNKKGSYYMYYSFKNDYGETVFNRARQALSSGQVDEFKRAGRIHITYFKSRSRITHSDAASYRENKILQFERYSREDKMFAVLKKELDKEISFNAKRKLLTQHSDLMPPQTMSRLEEYIEFTS